MAATTDTLIFELKVKDDASKVFDAWEKRLKNLEKLAKDIDISGALNDSFSKMGNLDASFGSLVSGAGSILTSGFTSIFGGLVDIATSAFTAILDVGIAAVSKVVSVTTDFVKDSISTYISFEDQLALVGKTTGMAGEKLSAFGDEIRNLAKPIGSLTAENLLQVAEVAGQLGIQNDDIGKFAVQIGKGAVAMIKFGGSTEKLATHIAKQQNVFGLAADSADNLLSVMDAMSKNTAANELQISNFNLGMAKVASTMGITADEASALGAVLISGGLDASSASRLLSSSLTDLSTKSKSLSAAVKLMNIDMNTGGQGIQQLEQITGRSRESFASLSDMIKTAFGVDAVAALTAVSGAFDKLPQGAMKTELAYDMVGKTGMAVLSLLGDAANRNADDTKSLAFALKTANEAYQSGQSHLDSYAIATEKTSEKIKEFWSVVDAIKLVIGEEFTAAIGQFMERANEFINEIAVWVEESETFKMVLADVVAFLQTMANFALDALIAQFRALVAYLDNDGANAWDNFATAIAVWMDKFGKWVTDAIAWVREFLAGFDSTQASASISEIISGLGNIIAAIGPVASAFTKIWDSLVKVKDMIAQAAQAVGSFAETIGIVDTLVNSFEFVVDVLSTIYLMLTGDFPSAWEAMKDAVGAIGDQFDLLRDRFSRVFQGIKEIASDVLSSIADFIKNKFDSALSAVGDKIASVWNTIKGLVSDTDSQMDKAAASADNVAKGIEKTAAAADAATEAVDKFTAAQEKAEDVGVTHSTWPALTEGIQQTQAATEILTSSIEQVNGVMQSVESTGVSSLNKMGAAAGNLASQMQNVQRSATIAANATKQMEAIRTQVKSKGAMAEYRAAALEKPTQKTQAEPTRQSSSLFGDKKTTTTTKLTSVSVNFSGMNVIDESTKNRFARLISNAQNNITSQTVTA